MDRIKESFDSLPIAACFFDKNGVVRLINRRMLAIANWLRKGGIQSLAEMQSVLHSPPANVRCLDLRLRIYRFPDGKALRFAQEQITTKAGVRYTQITAADVTELIRKQNQLKAENAKLAEANERLRRLLVQMPEIIREEETLAMKLRVHDDIGHSILAARRVLLQQTDLKELRANAALWEQSISVLFRSSQITAQSEPLEAAKKRAEELGVRVLLTGREPQRQWIRTLSALAICECAANCVRHADGTELYVRFRQKPDCMEVALTNNGAVPKEKITEGGGLSMLRQRIEEAGGKMEIWSIPRFTLMLPSFMVQILSSVKYTSTPYFFNVRVCCNVSTVFLAKRETSLVTIKSNAPFFASSIISRKLCLLWTDVPVIPSSIYFLYNVHSG